MASSPSASGSWSSASTFSKFPNHFAFGGVTGFSTVFSQLLHCSASTFTTAANYALLVLGFIFLGKSVGVRTVYATIVMSVSLQALDALVPMHGTLTDQPMLELVFAIMLPAIGRRSCSTSTHPRAARMSSP